MKAQTPARFAQAASPLPGTISGPVLLSRTALWEVRPWLTSFVAGVLIMGSDPGPMELFLLSVLVHDRPGESWGWPFGDWTQSVTPKLGLLTVTLTLLCRSCGGDPDQIT